MDNREKNIDKEITTIKVYKDTREKLKDMKDFGKSDAIRIENILEEFSSMKELIYEDVKEIESEFQLDVSRDVEFITSIISDYVNQTALKANEYVELETKKRIENAMKDFEKQSKIFHSRIENLKNTLELDVSKLSRDLCLKLEYIQELEKQNEEKDILINDYKRKTKTYSELTAKYEASQDALKRETYKANDLEIEVKETAKLKIEKASLETEVENLKEENKTLSLDFAENKGLKAELEALKSATQYVNLTIENFVKEKLDLQSVIEQERNKNKSLEEEKESLLKEIEELKKIKK